MICPKCSMSPTPDEIEEAQELGVDCIICWGVNLIENGINEDVDLKWAPGQEPKEVDTT